MTPEHRATLSNIDRTIDDILAAVSESALADALTGGA